MENFYFRCLLWYLELILIHQIRHDILYSKMNGWSLMRKANPNLRTNIINAAKVQFLMNGFTGTSLRKLGTELNISKGTIYNYFTNKDALFIACVGTVAEEFDNALMEIEKFYSHEMNSKEQNPTIFSQIEKRLVLIFEQSKTELDLLLNCSDGSQLAGGAARLEKITLLVTLEIFRLNQVFPHDQSTRKAQAELFAHNLIAGLLVILRRNDPAKIHAQLLKNHMQMFNAGLKMMLEENK